MLKNMPCFDAQANSTLLHCCCDEVYGLFFIKVSHFNLYRGKEKWIYSNAIFFNLNSYFRNFPK